MENFKRFVRFFSGYIQVQMGIDKSSALDKYIEISKQYTIPEQIDGYIAKYEDLQSELEQMLLFCKEEVENSCQGKTSCKVLDYGCGSGRYMELLAQYDIYGIDANSYTLEKFTHKKVPKAKLFSLDFTEMNDTQTQKFIQIHQGTFDVVYSITVIQLLRRSQIGLWFDNMTKVLKVGGKIILNFPVPKDLIDRYHVGYVRYTPEEIIGFLQSRGFKIEKAFSNIYHDSFLKYQPKEVDYGYNIVAIKE